MSEPPAKREVPVEPDLGPLPGGHHGLSREQVLESQRERLLAALAHVVAAEGYRQATIGEIVKAASVSSRAFYENFESKEDCFLAAFDAVVGHLRELIAAAVKDADGGWPESVIAALRATVEFFADEPDLARLCLVEPITASPAIATRFRAAVLSGIPYLEPGRAERPGGEPLPDSTEDLLLGGLIVLMARAILAGEPGSLPGRLPDLIEFALSPYLGSERAKRLALEASA